MSTNRIQKVNSLLEHEIGKIIQRDFDFPPNVLVTLTHVDASANLIEAKAFISVFFTQQNLGKAEPDENKVNNIIKMLNNRVYDVQKEINKKLNMRPIPKIKFVKDINIKSASRVEELLASLHSQAELKNQKK